MALSAAAAAGIPPATALLAPPGDAGLRLLDTAAGWADANGGSLLSDCGEFEHKSDTPDSLEWLAAMTVGHPAMHPTANLAVISDF